ncbi:MAG TPA: hypothetical protein V6C76_09915 [Drouetiella sp.]
MPTINQTFKNAWNTNRWLTALIAFSALWLLVSLMGLTIDHRLINGEHGWVKPIKFSMSLGIYGMTLIWLSKFLTEQKATFERVSIAALIGTIAELVTITIQAARGTASHFNTGTPFDHAMFWLAAISILPVAFGTIAIFFMLLRQRDLPPVLGLSLKWGVFLTIIGCIPGVLMLLPSTAQEFLSHSRQVTGHAVGLAQSSSHGLPLIGWSTVAGDLRVAHFVGIHALQLLPIVAYAVPRLLGRISVKRQEWLVNNVGLTYFFAIALLTHQALIAEPLTAPSHHTVAYALLLACISGLAAVYTVLLPERRERLDHSGLSINAGP